MSVSKFAGLGFDWNFDTSGAEVLPQYDTSSGSFQLPADTASYLATVDVPVSADSTNWWNDVANNVTKVAQTAAQVYGVYLTTQQASQLNAINLTRAQQGLPPLNPAQYGPTVNVGLSADTQRMLLYGVGALVALMLVMRRS